MKYTAKSKTGQEVTINDNRSFNYGFFSHTLIDCNKCSHKCKKGVTAFEGLSKSKRKSFFGCKEMKVEMEVVVLSK